MKTVQGIIALSIFIITLTGCSTQKVFTSENNQIIETTYEEVIKETDKCFVLIGKKDDRYTMSLSSYLEETVIINDKKIFLIYLDDIENDVSSILSTKKIPILYVLENNKFLDSIEYFNEEDVEGMDSLSYTKFLLSVKNKINKFVKENIE